MRILVRAKRYVGWCLPVEDGYLGDAFLVFALLITWKARMNVWELCQLLRLNLIFVWFGAT